MKEKKRVDVINPMTASLAFGTTRDPISFLTKKVDIFIDEIGKEFAKMKERLGDSEEEINKMLLLRERINTIILKEVYERKEKRKELINELPFLTKEKIKEAKKKAKTKEAKKILDELQKNIEKEIEKKKKEEDKYFEKASGITETTFKKFLKLHKIDRE